MKEAQIYSDNQVKHGLNNNNGTNVKNKIAKPRKVQKLKIKSDITFSNGATLERYLENLFRDEDVIDNGLKCYLHICFFDKTSKLFELTINIEDYDDFYDFIFQFWQEDSYKRDFYDPYPLTLICSPIDEVKSKFTLVSYDTKNKKTESEFIFDREDFFTKVDNCARKGFGHIKLQITNHMFYDNKKINKHSNFPYIDDANDILFAL